VLFVRDHHSYPGWILPVAGGTLFAFLGTLWVTSGFSGAVRCPRRS
jgi:Family of unknown function (DUF6529)